MKKRRKRNNLEFLVGSFMRPNIQEIQKNVFKRPTKLFIKLLETKHFCLGGISFLQNERGFLFNLKEQF